MFAFAFEGALFAFEYTNPHAAPLFAVPPKRTPLGTHHLLNVEC